MIREFNDSDLNSLIEIENQCFLHPWTKEMFESEINNGSYFYVYEIDNKVIGYMDVHLIQDVLELNNIAIVKDKQNCGYGQKLLDYMLEVARKNNIKQIFLEVNSNNNAYYLYKKNGFEENRVRKNYYPDGDAIEMKKELQ